MRIFRFAGYIVLLIFVNAVLGLRQNIRAQGITTGSISGNGANFSVNGQRGRVNSFEIDDQANNDTSITGSQVLFGNDEAIAEIQVITNQF